MDIVEARRILGVSASAGASDVESAYFGRLAALRASGADANADAIRELGVARNICFGRPADAAPPTEPPPPSTEAKWGVEEFDSPAPAPAPTPKPTVAGGAPAARGVAKSVKGPAAKPAPAPTKAAQPTGMSSPGKTAGAATTGAPSAPPARSVMDSRKPAAAPESAAPRSKKKLYLLAGAGVVVLAVVAVMVFSKGPKKLPGSLASDVAALRKAATASRSSSKDASLDAMQAEAEAAEKDAAKKVDAGDDGAVAAMQKAKELWSAVAVARVVAPAAAKARKKKDEWVAIAKYVEGGAPKAAKEAEEAMTRGEKLSTGTNLRGAADAYLLAERLYSDAASTAGRPALESLAKAVQKRAEDSRPLAKGALARLSEGQKSLDEAKAALEAATGSARATAARAVVAARLAVRSLTAEKEAYGDEKAQITRAAELRSQLDAALRAGREGRAPEMAEGLRKAQASADEFAARAAVLVATVEAVLNPSVVTGEGAGSYTAKPGTATAFPPAIAAALAPMLAQGGGGVRLDLASERTFSMSGGVGLFGGYLAGTWSRSASGLVSLTVWEEDDGSLEEPRPVAASLTLDPKEKTFSIASGSKGAPSAEAAAGLAGDLRPLLRAVVLDLRDRWKATGLLIDVAPSAGAGGDEPAAAEPAPSPAAVGLTPEGARDVARSAIGAAGDGYELVKAQAGAVGRIAAADRAAAEAASPRRQAAAKDLAALEAATKTLKDPASSRELCAAALAALVQAEAGLPAALAEGGGTRAATAPSVENAGRYVMSMDAWQAPPHVRAGLVGDDVALDLRRDGVFTLSTQWGTKSHAWAGTWSPSAAEEGAVSLVVLLDDREVLATAIASQDWWVKVFPKKSTFAFRTARFGGKIPWAEKLEPLVPSEPRALVLKSPADGKVLEAGQPVVVSGTVVPTPHATLTINGQNVAISKSNEFSTSLAGPEGEAALRIEATYGGEKLETVYATRTVYVDGLAPRLSVTAPAQADVTTDDAAVTIRGEATDPHVERVTLNEQAVEIRDEGGDRWSFQKTIPLAPGADVTVAVVAFDSLGHASAPSTIRLRRTAATTDAAGAIGDSSVRDNPAMETPMLVLDAPRTGSSVAGLTVDVSGRVKDTYDGDAVVVNGVPLEVTNKAFSTSLSFATRGWHIVLVEMRRGGAPVVGQRIVCRVLVGM